MFNIKRALEHGNCVIGTWCQTGNLVAAEIMAAAGFDFVAADMEHAAIGTGEFAAFCRAVRDKSVPMARVSENAVMPIRKALDCGAGGVIVPLVSSKEDAERAVRAAKYPPQGIRGFAFVQANGWGEAFDRYAACANEEISVIVMIETKAGVEHIDEILGVEGVDGVLIGPYDLSGSYGVVGQTNHPLVDQARDKVLQACKRQCKAAGQHIVLPKEDTVARAISEGYTFLALGMDTVFLTEGAKHARELAQ